MGGDEIYEQNIINFFHCVKGRKKRNQNLKFIVVRMRNFGDLSYLGKGDVEG